MLAHLIFLPACTRLQSTVHEKKLLSAPLALKKKTLFNQASSSFPLKHVQAGPTLRGSGPDNSQTCQRCVFRVEAVPDQTAVTKSLSPL